MSDQHTLPTGHVRHVATERFASRITGPEFDTWLASVKADAWDEAVEVLDQLHGDLPGLDHIVQDLGDINPYREQETP